MRRTAVILMLVLATVWGCAHKRQQKQAAALIQATPAPYQQFVAQNFDWSSVQRVVLMPLANQTAYPKATEELQANLAAELQRTGRFDIVVATRDDPGARAQDIFRGVRRRVGRAGRDHGRSSSNVLQADARMAAKLDGSQSRVGVPRCLSTVRVPAGCSDSGSVRAQWRATGGRKLCSGSQCCRDATRVGPTAGTRRHDRSLGTGAISLIYKVRTFGGLIA